LKIADVIKVITRNVCLAEPHKSVKGKGQEWGKITKKTKKKRTDAGRKEKEKKDPYWDSNA